MNPAAGSSGPAGSAMLCIVICCPGLALANDTLISSQYRGMYTPGLYHMPSPARSTSTDSLRWNLLVLPPDAGDAATEPEEVGEATGGAATGGRHAEVTGTLVTPRTCSPGLAA